MEEVRKANNPKITVITPTYNRGDLITETIRSVLAQDFKDFEYLILDDGSTDNTEEVVKPYLKDARVRYLKHTNVGEAETVNWGWSLAKGEYFTQVNSDDPILPGLFSEMSDVLDRMKDVVVAYPDFCFINGRGAVTKKDKTKDWNFLSALSNFSCYAASAGTFIRISAFQDWTKIKDSRYRYISDVEMYWRMALRGDFFHVGKFLATWRLHDGNISLERYKSIPEVQRWFYEYFSAKDLPQEVKECEQKVRDSIYRYCISLINQSNLKHKEELMREFDSQFFGSKVLHIGDNDLIGNKFNGHDLHYYLEDKGIKSKHLVWNKESGDINTLEIARNRLGRKGIYLNVLSLQNSHALNGVLNPLWYDVLNDPLFLNAEAVHFHLVHNGLIDIQLLPLMSRLKPIVWTLHDPWALGGHCIHHFDCKKWSEQCADCPYLTYPFGLSLDHSALNFILKRDAIQVSNFDVIVASRWMEKKVKQSPIFKEKRLHLIPFGINQKVFKFVDKQEARRSLGIREDSMVLAFRCDPSEFKGLDVIEHTLRNISSKKRIVLLVLANKLRIKVENTEVIEYGWVKDDELLASIYAASDLFLMPSKVETFGMMAIEAMSCGTLPIVVEGTALADTVNAPYCGVETRRDKYEYSKTVQHFIDYEDERMIRAKRCLEFAKKHYNKDNYVQKLLKVYEGSVKRHKVTKEDQLLLNQLKKYSTKVAPSEQGKERKVIVSKWFDFGVVFLMRHKNIVPKNLRVAIRGKLLSKRQTMILEEIENNAWDIAPLKKKSSYSVLVKSILALLPIFRLRSKNRSFLIKE